MVKVKKTEEPVPVKIVYDDTPGKFPTRKEMRDNLANATNAEIGAALRARKEANDFLSGIGLY